MSKVKCGNCEHWKVIPKFDNEVGTCTGLLNDGIDIELFTGCDGGGIESVETNCSFFCANFKTTNG